MFHKFMATYYGNKSMLGNRSTLVPDLNLLILFLGNRVRPITAMVATKKSRFFL